MKGALPLRTRGAEMMNGNKKVKQPKYEVPLWHKTNLSIAEAVAYTGIGRDKLYEIALAAAALFIAAAGILLLMAVAGIVLFCMSIPYISNNTSVGLFFMGTGMVMASAAVLLFVPVMNLVFYIFKLTVKSLILLFNKLIGRKAVKV